MRRDPQLLLFNEPANCYNRKGLWLTLGVYVGALLLAAVIAPLVYFPMSQMDNYLGNKPFSDYYDRLRWLPVLLNLPWLLKKTGLVSLSKLGLATNPGWFRLALRWFLVGALLAGIVAGTQVAMAPVILEHAGSPGGWLPPLLKRLVTALLAGIALGLLEEPILRGLVFRSCYTALRPGLAVVAASLFFAYVHFKIPGSFESRVDADPGIISGFEAAFYTASGVLWNFEAAKFLNLFLLGCALCLLYVRYGSLWPCVGLHAGLVWVNLTYAKTIDMPAHDLRWFTGSEDLISSWPTALVLFALIIIMRSMTSKRMGKSE